MNPTILQTLQMMASVSSSEKLDKKARDKAAVILDSLLDIVKADVIAFSASQKNIVL